MAKNSLTLSLSALPPWKWQYDGKLPRVTAAEAVKVLERAGFLLVRQSGSHKIYKNKESKRATVPYDTGRTLHPKVLQSILRDANITVKKFKDLLK